MCAPGGEAALQQRQAGLPCANCAVAREGELPAVVHHRHPFAVAFVAADGALDLSTQRLRQTPDQRLVAAIEVAVGEGRGQGVGGKLGFGYDHDAGSVLVQTMHDARAALGADAGEPGAAMREQRVHQRTVKVARRRMHHQSSGFVEDDKVGVFVQDRERDRLRPRGRLYRRGQIQDVGGSGSNQFSRLGDRPVAAAQPSFIDQRLDPGARDDTERVGEEAVNSLAGVFGGGRDADWSGWWWFAVGWHLDVG
jgi:hypothetical protein